MSSGSDRSVLAYTLLLPNANLNLSHYWRGRNLLEKVIKKEPWKRSGSWKRLDSGKLVEMKAQTGTACVSVCHPQFVLKGMELCQRSLLHYFSCMSSEMCNSRRCHWEEDPIWKAIGFWCFPPRLPKKFWVCNIILHYTVIISVYILCYCKPICMHAGQRQERHPLLGLPQMQEVATDL